jgi:hypothetical protein
VLIQKKNIYQIEENMKFILQNGFNEDDPLVFFGEFMEDEKTEESLYSKLTKINFMF